MKCPKSKGEFGWGVRMGSSDGVRMEFASIRTGGCSYEVRMKLVRTKLFVVLMATDHYL